MDPPHHPATLLGAAGGAAGLAVSLHYRVATAAGTAVICGALFIVAATTTLVGRARRPDFADRPQVCDATAT
ncbi:hypothetical protein NE235_13960 [Actinoallomurus spadix]|uniref:Uncharacterized protein n=1 Tax=Actinoallomurus spadix TaxID=79912 RepID=A0ABN0WDX9_9ACTN|nr:hypothetical protein [Actinoallomurus spadix]MCO5987207.1 hypothetical protein [Actinoallomurus spadix]